MTRNNQKIREQVMEMEQAADIALAAVQAEDGAGEGVRASVERLHDWARQAKQSLVNGGQENGGEDAVGDLGGLRGAIAAAEEAADQALEDVKDDLGVGKATKAAIKEAHDAAKKAKDLF